MCAVWIEEETPADACTRCCRSGESGELSEQFGKRDFLSAGR